MNKALEQKLIGPMEESHTKEQSPQAVLWEVLWARRSKMAAKWAWTRVWAGYSCLWEEGVCGWNDKWRRATVGPRWPSSTYHFTHTLLPPTNMNIQLKPESKLILLPFSISLLKAPLTKLLGEIVPWYVTPPLVQLVFVLVLYSLQICAA